MQKIAALTLLIFGFVTFWGCSKNPDSNPILPPSDTTSLPVPSPLKETFESGSKSDYPSASISLSSGKWNFTEALIGSSVDDKKNGTKSVRIRNNGRVSMNFDIINGVYRVIISHAAYANNQSSTWQLWASYNSGTSYSQVGNTVTSASTVLVKDTFLVNTQSKVRFSIRKISGDNNQVNIDDIDVVLAADPYTGTLNDNDNMLMGNPSGATPSIISANNFLMDKTYYTLCYNRDEAKPNWVSWHLQSSDIGSVARQNDFREDFSLPSTWYKAAYTSYSSTGFDRGHNCPSADRTSTLAANSSTFLMSNMIPQAPMLNQNAWGRLEDSCRALVAGGRELFIITGSFGSGGIGNNGAANSIDNSSIVVPQYVWKVVVVLPLGNNDLARVNASTRVIAVLAPNSNSADTNWKNLRVSVDSIESQTGYDLLSNVPAAVQQMLEARVDAL